MLLSRIRREVGKPNNITLRVHCPGKGLPVEACCGSEPVLAIKRGDHIVAFPPFGVGCLTRVNNLQCAGLVADS